MDPVIQVQIPEEAICLSHTPKTLEKKYTLSLLLVVGLGEESLWCCD